MNKQKLFEELLKKKGITVTKGPTLAAGNEPGPYPLSFAQRRIWFLQQFDEKSGAYNDPTALRIRGPLNISRLEQTLNTIICRHSVLRMTFSANQGRPLQSLHNNEGITIGVVPLEPPANGKPLSLLIKEFVNRYSAEPFDLANEMPIRAALLKINDNDGVLVVNIHHLVMDGWSKGIMLRELMEIYEVLSENAPPPLPELPVQYTDYVRWHHQFVQGQLYETQMNYWRDELAGAPPMLELPTEFPRPGRPSGKGSLEPFSLTKKELDALKGYAVRENSTLFMLLMAAYTTFLYRYSGQEDILVGTPTAGRPRMDLEKLIGLFVNTLVIRTDLSGEPTFKNLLGRVRSKAMKAMSNQDIPFEKLVEELNPQRNMSVTPLFQVMFQLQNAPMPPAQLSGLTITPLQIDTGFSQADLSLTMWEETQEDETIMKGTFEYNTDLFTPEGIQRMIRHFKSILEEIIRDAAQSQSRCIADFPMMSEEETHRIVEEWNRTEADYPAETSIDQLFEAAVKKYPQEKAVIYGEHNVTYAALDIEAEQLARRLQHRQVGPEKLVAICMENSIELIAGVMGILKAGAGYIPMDPANPDRRLKKIIRDARPSIVLTQQSLFERLNNFETDSEIMVIEGRHTGNDANRNDDPTDGENNSKRSADNTACVIYTSGTTGEPRGIIMSHRNIVNLVTSFTRSYAPAPGDRILPLTSIASASFVGEILPVLASGGGIVLAAKEHFLDREKLQRLLIDNEVTIMSTVPSMIARLNAGQMNPGRLRLLLSGGEALSAGDIDRLRETVTIVNGYGLTEATICSTYIILDRNNAENDVQPVISVGKPVINTRVYILDRQMNPVPTGVPGEIYVGGDGITRGYLNNPEQTVEKFIDPPCSLVTGRKNIPDTSLCSAPSVTKLYKTGDLGCWLSDGNIKFLGRIDTQVQLHGYRIELSEIETHLGLHPDIQDTVVIDREVAPGDRRLVAYYVVEKAENGKRIPPSGTLLRDHLAKRIPDYMVPTIYEEVEAIPLNINGKADINKLPLPSLQRPELEVDYKAPQSNTEKAIAVIWKDILRLEKIGINDNFFDLGGHSLLLTQVHGRLLEQFNDSKKITIVDLFRYPTIMTLAKYISGSGEQEQVRRAAAEYQKMKTRAGMQRQAFKRQRRAI
jgi:amino acid adenylation domain-containing protein